MMVFEHDHILTGPKISHFRGFTVLAKLDYHKGKIQFSLEAYIQLLNNTFNT